MIRLRPLAAAFALMLAACAHHGHRAPHAGPTAAPAPPNLAAPAPVAVPPAEAAAPVAPAPAPAHPALWKIARGNTTIWLFGTIHALPADYPWEDDALEGAVKGADALVLETVLDRDPGKAAGLIYGMGRAAGLPPLADRAPEAKRAALASTVARSGIPATVLDGLKTWTAAMMLMTVPLADMKLSAADGVEPRLEAEFKAAGKPISGLETPEQQLGYFDHLSEGAQRDFLGTVVDDPVKMRSDFEAMLSAWAKGDEQAIAATFDDDLQVSPELREALLARRNAAWTDWIAARLDQPGKILIAVGAGHLAGPGSVIERLKAKGIVAERVQ